MRIVAVFLALVVLLTLTSCGKEEVEVTRVVKETVLEQVEVKPVFDAKAEEKAVMVASEAINDAFANVDKEALDKLLHKDWSGFATYEEGQLEFIRQSFLRDLGPPGTDMKWYGYDVTVAPDLAVVKGKMVWEPSDNPKSSRAYRYVTSVFKKEDGQWQLIHSHVSYMP